jgi:hypothetical protein
MRKILYSPGYGAGWTSWESDYELRKFMLVYQPIIDYVEKGGSFGEKDHGRCLEIWNYKTGEVDPEKVAKLPDCLNQFIAECQEKFGKVPYLGGLRDIKIKIVSGPVQIDDFDGSESVEEGGGEWL